MKQQAIVLSLFVCCLWFPLPVVCFITSVPTTTLFSSAPSTTIITTAAATTIIPTKRTTTTRRGGSGASSSSTVLYSTAEEQKKQEETTMEATSTSTTTTNNNNNNNEYPDYTDAQLKAALDGLLVGSTNPSFDARHLFGFQDPNHQLSKLQSITAHRILDYQTYLADPSTPSEETLREKCSEFAKEHGPILNLQQVIQEQAPRMALAAEFKRASPSKGDIAPNLNAGEQAVKYTSAGASIISVLTETRWFKGSLDDLTQVRLETTKSVLAAEGGGTPPQQRPAVLRKEFCTNKYQITEAIASGADTILLIVAVLPQHLLRELIDHARSLGMEPLVEVHADSELDVAIQAGAKVIGVNNRNLHTFQMDLQTTEHAAEELTKRGITFTHDDTSQKDNIVLCSLSGMSSAMDVDRYRKINVGMCLIGESLMRAADPKLAIASLCLDPKDRDTMQTNGGGAYTAGTKIIKVCGITNPDDALVACKAGANLIGIIFVPKSKRCVTSEQGKLVVDTVRKFGERSQRMTINTNNKEESAIHQLVTCSQVLENASRRPLVVGVFQNQSPEFIRDMVQTCGLDLVQLHGKEGMKAANPELCGDVPAIRVVDIETDPETGKASSDATDKLLESLTTDPIAILLDTSIKGNKEGGGTGVTFDWTIAERIQNSGVPVIIAGGLTADNVQDAVSTVRPWGVDVSSGVEASPGQKDHDKVKEFVGGARRAAIEASKGF